MSRYAPIELLAPDLDRSAFDCGSAAQTAWLRERALFGEHEPAQDFAEAVAR